MAVGVGVFGCWVCILFCLFGRGLAMEGPGLCLQGDYGTYADA